MDQLTPEEQAAPDTTPDTPEVAVDEVPVEPAVGEQEAKTPLDNFTMDELLFDNGPTRAQVEEMKKKYPASQVLCVLFADGSGIIYRTVTRFEWRGIQKLIASVSEPDQKDDIIFSKIVLWPDLSDRTKINDMPAGAVMSVMNEFYVYSGFTPAAESMRL